LIRAKPGFANGAGFAPANTPTTSGGC
jgi:hypothetical protein